MGSYQVSNDTLSKTSKWISDVLATLQGYLKEIEEKKGEIDEYSERLRGAFQTPTGISQVLKCLLFPKSPEHHYVYYRSTKSRVKIDEMLKNKCVLLFISGLFGIEDEIKLLKEISEDLASNPKCEKDGMRKSDFKILWVPIVSSSLDSEKIKTQFNFIAQQFVTWSCVVDYSIVGPACKKLIRQKLRYMNKPMIAVFNQQGSRTNNDALAMLFAWGHHAFPWSTGDDLIFVRNWNWFWSILKDINQQLSSLNEKDYNIIFGCMDEADTNNYDGSWLGKITVELEKIKRDKIISSSGFAIKYYHHGKQAENDFKFAYKFWAFVENVFTSLKSMKTTTIKDDPSLDNLKKFLALRREKSGWVIISQGSEVKMVGSGVSVYKTLYKFESWKHNITQHGFDGAFVNEYFNEFPPQSNCLRLDLKTNVSDVSVPLECVTCQSEMEIQLVRYVCCHGNHSRAKYVHRLA
ncbi:protein SIEVE ELEMENT OCCLUSION B-like [Prosopis cineraria]|uniref:protein SIEVE ELEMENT OCCLUSION B-like n=1 Tax=Prosopis cineraria TaxID=364024 RepID=UPI002410515E|nr:protein SIEVE ELEMENT OCCLUSION B-like [Prosopis cineraria]